MTNIFKCIDCETATSSLPEDIINKMLIELQTVYNGWQIEGNSLTVKLIFKNFNKPLKFVKDVAEISNGIRHHPDISFGWGYCNLKILTHKVNGLTETDFYLAEKISKDLIVNI